MKIGSLAACEFCGQPEGVDYVEFYSDEPGRMRYPRNDDVRVSVTHTECGPDGGYAIELERILADPTGWKRHIGEKRWGSGIERVIDRIVKVHGVRSKPQPAL